MREALWVDRFGRRTQITRADDGAYTYEGCSLPNGHYAFHTKTWRHVLYGPYDTPDEAVKIMGK